LPARQAVLSAMVVRHDGFNVVLRSELVSFVERGVLFKAMFRSFKRVSKGKDYDAGLCKQLSKRWSIALQGM
jgi:hypothetical protein